MNTDQDPPNSETEISEPFKKKPNSAKNKFKKELSPAFVEFQIKVDGTPNMEDKIRFSLEFMKEALSFPGKPRFEDFWSARRFCIGFFKEALNPAVRSDLWHEYLALSSEARRVKEIVDEQSAFAVEQIELAIQAMESDLPDYAGRMQEMKDLPFPYLELSLAQTHQVYAEVQKELHVLNNFASRISSLRKEVAKTGMRIRLKSQFFERLSSLGDKVFPKRKDLIKQISDLFLEDIKTFVREYFAEGGTSHPPLYILREEIKALQDLAKILTLNTYAFTETRLVLSACWDKVKEWEKERKKEISQKKQQYQQNYEAMQAKREEIAQQEAEIAKKEQKRKERIDTLKKEIEALLEGASLLPIEEIAASREKFTKEIESQTLSRAEKQIFEKLFKQLRDLVAEKKEKAMLELSPEALQSLEKLKEVLQTRKKMRQEIKEQLETHRKALSGSGFDFEKAMMYRELMETEKARVEKINAAIDDIEEKIVELEGE